ncbi:type II toxin-antitoxin system HicB family antitoxin [Halorhabdus salina]|uniref:type II toxin-antitoxin system HicB family antitoxin n=1 Tax=Halorhabdus salina TaxID=2750670 RepID=UPI0015EF890E|nr:type II toxin-antitoxin system HicB family antitoxin [Halorhabdus salina]
MSRANYGDADAPNREIRLLKNPDGQWTARDLEIGVSAQSETREGALANLDDVVTAVEDDGGHEPTDEELQELGVDPETARSQDDELPDVLR